jgi:hypothetical protein
MLRAARRWERDWESRKLNGARMGRRERSMVDRRSGTDEAGDGE